VLHVPLDTLPIQAFENPCIAELTNMAIANAYNAYQNHVDSLLTAFRNDYIAHCMSLKETMTRRYKLVEHHFTLYYYDQAGNLIKTIPPEGVECLPITAYNDPLALQVASDRAGNTQTVVTSHRMATVYKYNSLNQLVAQHMPDMDDISKWSQSLANGLDVMLVTNAIQMLDASNGYLAGYVTNSNAGVGTKRGYLYRTTDGGANWTRITNLFTSDLKAIKMVNTTTGFAVGVNGVALRTLDGGNTWDLLNIHSLGINADFVDVAVKDQNNAAFIASDGKIVQYSSANLFLATVSYPTSPSLVTAIQEVGGTAAMNNYLMTGNFTANGETNGRIFRVTLTGATSTITPTEELAIGDTWNDVSMYSYLNGVSVGTDGDAALSDLTTNISFFRTSNNSGNILSTLFLNATNGVAIIKNGSTQYLYSTLDGGKNWTIVNV
jgi:YD repeat-containing protein